MLGQESCQGEDVLGELDSANRGVLHNLEYRNQSQPLPVRPFAMARCPASVVQLACHGSADKRQGGVRSLVRSCGGDGPAVAEEGEHCQAVASQRHSLCHISRPLSGECDAAYQNSHYCFNDTPLTDNVAHFSRQRGTIRLEFVCSSKDLRSAIEAPHCFQAATKSISDLYEFQATSSAVI